MNLNLYKNVSIQDFIVYLFICISSVFVIAWIGFSILGQSLSDPVNLEITTLMVNSLLVAAVIVKLKKDNIKITNLLGKPEKNSYILEVPFTLIINFMCSVGVVLLISFIMYKINPSSLNAISNNTYVKSNPLFLKIITFTHLVILAPIAEELIFRGIILNRFYNKYGLNKSILYTSLLFAAIHFDKALFIFPIGLSCSMLVYKYKSIIPSIMLHMLNNLFVFAVMVTSEGSGSAMAPVGTSSIWYLVIPLLLIAIYSFYIYKNYPKKHLIENYITEYYN